ncbi:MAG: GNAT family N-acetyltransferase, partial [Gemmatimonadaceae bacterium]
MITEPQQLAQPAAWTITPECPENWHELLPVCHAGFFHSPSGLLAGSPEGGPLYCVHSGKDGVDAVALGVRHACRLSRQARHVYFPSAPALRISTSGLAIVRDLVATLRDLGVADVTMGSFDATWCPAGPTAAFETRREEFVISLTGTSDEIFARCSAHRRREIRKADKTGMAVRTHTGVEARRALDLVQESARERAKNRGAPFAGPPMKAFANEQIGSDSPWGATAFGAWDGDTLLSAALVGWAGRRAYNVAGGGTPAGYQSHAGAWLHWQITTALASAGFVTYNLGGAASDKNGQSGL